MRRAQLSPNFFTLHELLARFPVDAKKLAVFHWTQKRKDAGNGIVGATEIGVKEKGDINRMLSTLYQRISFPFLLFQESVDHHEFGGLLLVLQVVVGCYRCCCWW